MLNINQDSEADKFTSSEIDGLTEYVLNFKELFEINFDKIKKISNTRRESSLNAMIGELMEDLNNFEILLMEYECLKKECYIYLDIELMATYILKKGELIKPDNLEFIQVMLFSFLELLKSRTCEDYPEKYKDFRFKLIEWNRNFYSNICTRSKYYDEEVLSEIKNLLLG